MPTKNEILTAAENAKAAGNYDEALELLQSLEGSPIVKRAMPKRSATDAFIVGMGRTGDKLLSGAEKSFMGPTSIFSGGMDRQKRIEQLKQEEADKDRAYAPLQAEHPIATSAGELTPYLAVPGGATLRGAAGAGGIMGGLTYAPEDQWQNALLGAGGAAAGYGVGKGFGMGWQGLKNKWLGPRKARLVKRAEELDYKLSPGHSWNSDALQKMEASMESSPMAAGAFQRLNSGNQKTVNRVAARTIGEEADEVTDEVLGRASRRMNRMFAEATRNTKAVNLDDAFWAKVDAIDTHATRGLIRSPNTEDIIYNLVEEAGGSNVITPAQYQKFQSELGSEIRSIFRKEGGQNAHAFALADIQEALHDAARRSLPPEKVKLFDTAREQWRHLVLLENPGVTNVSSGDVSGKTLANVLRRKDKTGFGRGGDHTDLYDIARISQTFKPIVGDSGTATRMSGAMTAMRGAAGYGLAQESGSDNPMLWGLLAAGSPMLGRSYLTDSALLKGLLQNTPKMLGKGATGVLMTGE